ncbi:MAG: SHOCT domain-containing protein [Nitrosopumilus sp.]|jgi:hypothetical protein
MVLKTEKSIKEYLETLSDDTIIKYYLDVEYSPFPILVMQEYTRRFKKKTKDQIIDDLKLQTKLARQKTTEIAKMAQKHKGVDEIAKKKSEEFIKQAKKKGFEIGQSISKSKIKSKFKSSTQKHLDELEKLGQLKRKGVISAAEFNTAKKKILGKI